MVETTRQRCTVTGCNPHLSDLSEADAHRERTGHRTAAWPVRSAEGTRREGKRNRTGYHRKYQLAGEERELDLLVTERWAEQLTEAINTMTPKTREQTKAAQEAYWTQLGAQRRSAAALYNSMVEDCHPFSEEGLGQI